MRILYIAPSPANSMGRIRTQNIIRAMQQLGHDVTLVSFVYNDYDVIALERCKSYIADIRWVKQPKWKSLLNCFLGLLLPIPLRVSYCRSKKMSDTIERCLCEKEYDLIYIKRLRMAQYAYLGKRKGIFTIVDITDSLTKYYERIRKKEHGINKILAIEEYYKHRIYEPRICKQNAPVVICSEDDKNYLLDLAPELKNVIHVMNNSIEIDFWRSVNVTISAIGRRNRLTFLGVMDYAPNIIAAKYLITQVMPLLPEQYKLEIIGANCTEELLHYESERVHFTGYVEDMRAALRNNDIFICPILAGSGVKNKILQASLVGLPIISTTLGIEGIHKDILRYVFVADEAKLIAENVLYINQLTEKKLKERILGQQEVIIRNNDNVLALRKCFKELGFCYE
ncbi:MAG: glycosyltransferase family 4 protein [Lachnospiraceae bacterium]